MKDVGTGSGRIARILTVRAKYVNILQAMSSKIPRAPRIQPHLMGNHPTDTGIISQPISKKNFTNKIPAPPTLWNACDYVLQFNFRIMHVAGSQNTAAVFLSRLELTPKEKNQLTLRDDIQTSPMEVILQSSDVADED